MKSSYRIKKTFQIEYRNRLYSISLLEDENGLLTRQFKPPELLKLKNHHSLENEDDFLKIWVRYIIGLAACKEEHDSMERNIGALTFITMDHVEQYGLIDSDTLFTFMDCFAHSLHSEGFSDAEIRKAYLPVAKGIIDCFDDKIVDSDTRQEYKDSQSYEHLFRLSQ